MRLIETSDLRLWAARVDATSRFPYLVKELICAVVEPARIRFPSGAAVWLPGLDGVLMSNDKNRFVPTGFSVWELGTESRITTKANKDYTKRTGHKAPATSKPIMEINYPETTFVFITPLVWNGKEKWAAKCREDGIWKDVVALDAVDLQEWFQAAPAVSLQFAAELGLAPEAGLQIPDHAWEKWSHMTAPPASEALVVVGREEQEKELIQRLMAEPSTFTVGGDSPREAWGFTLAALRRVGSDEERMSFLARTIIADDEKVAGRLRNRKNLIILLELAKGQVSGDLSSGGFHVVIPEGTDARSQRNVITLARPNHYEFREVLEDMGLQKEEAEKASRECGRSVTIFQRQRPHANSCPPTWKDRQAVTNLLPALLAGRWNSKNPADQQILCQLADTGDYASVEALLQEFLRVDEAPLQKIGEMWTMTAPVDAFQLIAWLLTRAHLDRFKDAFRSVFGQIDPKTEIPPDQWLYQDLKREGSHSGWLRSGMAEALLLIAERGRNAELVCLDSPPLYAEEVVRGLPNLNDDWRVLASIRDQCALLMEAAPAPFLDSFEALLQAQRQDVVLLFSEGGGFGTEAMHTGLLWGLETLAWSPDYLPRVALILAQLARFDPGGRISNRPINSLREIFLWWHPGTNASLEDRLAALDLVLTQEPEVGWALLVKLLPGTESSLSHPTAKPRWRDFGNLPEDARTWYGQVKCASEIVERALDRVESDPERWRAFLQSLPKISQTQARKALMLLANIAGRELDLDLRATFWEMLREFDDRQRTLSDADWSLKGDERKQLEGVLAQLAPDDPVERSKWLFDGWMSGAKDLEDAKREGEELRRRAAREIFEMQGIEGLVRLGTTCKIPASVAIAAIPEIINLEETANWVDQAIAAGESGLLLARDISWRARQVWGEGWKDLVMKEARAGTWAPGSAAVLLLYWPNDRSTWEDAAALGEIAETEYWRRKPVSLFEGEPADSTYEIDRLIEVGRAAEVFDHTALGAPSVPSTVLLRIFDATFSELRRAKTAEEYRQLGLNSYDMNRFLDQMRQRKDIPRRDVAQREFQALPLLGLSLREPEGLTLHEFMAVNPKFFVEVLCAVFHPAHRDKSQDSEPSFAERRLGETGFLLLEGMRNIPGASETGEIDEEVLLQWIVAVRAMAADKDRAAIADLHIGKILAHASENPEDGGWPHRGVRNVIERLATNDIERGLMNERVNMRGIHGKDVYEGGTQERALATQYRGWAELSREHWPRVTKVLITMAEDWDEMGQREDVQAEQDKLD